MLHLKFDKLQNEWSLNRFISCFEEIMGSNGHENDRKFEKIDFFIPQKPDVMGQNGCFF